MDISDTTNLLVKSLDTYAYTGAEALHHTNTVPLLNRPQHMHTHVQVKLCITPMPLIDMMMAQ